MYFYKNLKFKFWHNSRKSTIFLFTVDNKKKKKNYRLRDKYLFYDR